MTAAVFYHSPELPWTVAPEDRRRFRRILTTVTVLALVFSIVIPLLPVPELARDMAPPLPSRYARLLMEHQPPPPPRPRATPPPREVPPPRVPEAKPEPARKKPAEKVAPSPQPEPRKPSVARAREEAARAGLLAFGQELADLRRHRAVSSVTRQKLKSQKLKSQKLKPAPTGETAPAGAAKIRRAILTRRARQASSGIDTARLSRDTGETRLSATHQTTRVASTLATSPRPGEQRRAGGLPRRSDEDIQRVFDLNKGRLYALYNRALRRDAGLQGKLVLRLTIDPDGKVTQCEIVSSELNNPRLERRLVARIKMFDFGAMDVAVTRITYPIEFFPG